MRELSVAFLKVFLDQFGWIIPSTIFSGAGPLLVSYFLPEIRKDRPARTRFWWLPGLIVSFLWIIYVVFYCLFFAFVSLLNDKSGQIARQQTVINVLKSDLIRSQKNQDSKSAIEELRERRIQEDLGKLYERALKTFAMDTKPDSVTAMHSLNNEITEYLERNAGHHAAVIFNEYEIIPGSGYWIGEKMRYLKELIAGKK